MQNVRITFEKTEPLTSKEFYNDKGLIIPNLDDHLLVGQVELDSKELVNPWVT